MSQEVSHRKCSINAGSRPAHSALSLPGGLLQTNTIIPAVPPTSPSNALNLGCCPLAPRPQSEGLAAGVQVSPAAPPRHCDFFKMFMTSRLLSTMERQSRPFLWVSVSPSAHRDNHPCLARFTGPKCSLVRGSANLNSASVLTSPWRTVYLAKGPAPFSEDSGNSGQEPARPLLTTKRLPRAKFAPGTEVCPDG